MSRPVHYSKNAVVPPASDDALPYQDLFKGRRHLSSMSTTAPVNRPSKTVILRTAISDKLAGQERNKSFQRMHAAGSSLNNNNNTSQVVMNHGGGGGGSGMLLQQQQQHKSLPHHDRPLSKRLIHSGISRVAVPQVHRDQVEIHYGSVLVLHLQCKNITAMPPSSLDAFTNLKNLYLYKNSIRRIQGLDRLVNLELLDMSRNSVERIDGLDKCRRLRKLYLGFNEIQVVEGIEGLAELEELLLDDQDIPPEQPLIFIPGIMETVGNSLVQLDVSANQLPSLRELSNLPQLQILVASNNLIDDLDETVGVLESLVRLQALELKGNPVAGRPRYKASVIGAVYQLVSLDGKQVSDTTRTCVQRLKYIKSRRQNHGACTQQHQKQQQLLNPHLVPSSDSQQQQLDAGLEFSFSTPTRSSPVQSVRTPPPKLKPKAASDNSISSSLYERSTKSSFSDTQMSDMARIIFRLSNLDGPVQQGRDGSGDAFCTGGVAKCTGYWEEPGSSMANNFGAAAGAGGSASGVECRPLSPIEMLDYGGAAGGTDADPPGECSSSSKKWRPKPAGPGGWSNNNERYVYGRTLSPLVELPTPESLTARDNNDAC